jgi:hypothetical protein
MRLPPTDARLPQAQTLAAASSTTQQVSKIGNVDGSEIQHEKVHVRGVDNLTTDDIKTFAQEHYAPEITRIEWIDDQSANIIDDNAMLASEALSSLTLDELQGLEDISSTDLRIAKKLSTHPEAGLQIRIAFKTDVKKPRASESSRFYLMNPEYDPSNRRKQYDGRRGGRRTDTRTQYADGDRPRQRRRSDVESKPFDENMYDDPPSKPVSIAAHSVSGLDLSDGEVGDDFVAPRPRRRRSADLVIKSGRMQAETSGRLRDRSASPTQEGDGRFGFGNDDTSGIRRRSPPRPRSTRPRELLADRMQSSSGLHLLPQPTSRGRDLISRVTPSTTKELFPAPASKELFPNKSSPPKEPADLFPRKGSHSHRRTAAFDASDSTGVESFADRMDSLAEPARPKPRKELFAERVTAPKVDLLAGRLTAKADGRLPPAADLFAGRSVSRSTTTAAANGFSIKGAAAPIAGGFSIKGAAGLNNPRIKELFPERGADGGNENKELFSGKIKGRGAQRKTAAELF